ncbi:hypothetical protein AB9K35_04190 [Leisingera sp. XS_AS12]|uniref:hypothetical protein n=1 Tax=Leisingera sp. XS_AS12 TaxID=3241294 RepID=UPI0035197F93
MSAIFRDMTADGLHASAENQKRAFTSWLRPGETVSYSGLAAELNRISPAPDGVKYPYTRAADRLVQKLRKAGMIELVKKEWQLTQDGAALRAELLHEVSP